MKLRKNEMKLRRNLPSPPWRFLISSVKNQSLPTPLLLHLLSFQKRSNFGNGDLTASRKEEEDASFISVAPSSY